MMEPSYRGHVYVTAAGTQTWPVSLTCVHNVVELCRKRHGIPVKLLQQPPPHPVGYVVCRVPCLLHCNRNLHGGRVYNMHL